MNDTTNKTAHTTLPRAEYLALRSGLNWVLSEKTKDPQAALNKAFPTADLSDFRLSRPGCAVSAYSGAREDRDLARYNVRGEVVTLGARKGDAEKVLDLLREQATFLRGLQNKAARDVSGLLVHFCKRAEEDFREAAASMAADLVKAATGESVQDATYTIRWGASNLSRKQEQAAIAWRILRAEGEDQDLLEAAEEVLADVQDQLLSDRYSEKSTCPYSNALTDDRRAGASVFLRSARNVLRGAEAKKEALARIARIAAL